MRTRPRDRKQQILAAASERFWTVGYHQVGMADIAAAVGIGASALYRHFRGKQELLLAILDEHLRSLEHLAADPGRDLIPSFAAFALERREFGVLWEREAGHLPADARRALRHRLRSLAAAVAAATGDADRPASDLRAWAVLSILDSPSHHRTRIEPARFEQLLRAAARAVLAAELPPVVHPAPPPSHRAAAIAPASRREALLAAAIRLFSERGYPSVGLDDIGAAAGIAGPSVYNHFDSKIDVLTAALHRGTEALWAGLHRALAAAENPADALDRLVADYAAFAAADKDIISILVSEIIHLPGERRTAFRRAEVDYVTEWVTLLMAARPDLTDADARVVVQAALALVNSLSRIPHLRAHPDLAARTALLAQAIFTAETKSG
ncbi:TetR/AcrR family transcriptional regulator [Amycolatopsis sp. H20-H5]|uniref:TetR/AcrR family transcriptional regulator n=1 Tax=Amycolatopsis sp. H20-H5 TaxID=3046309 RepID=UPI002DB5F09B|nr:TetR/AcrR family transcriptional regulator [Amycolatopsis sp. H20-H5]MEC3975759.1 TetR/AcrR family transcriptional regulator [Amycolatopsis sp. H20-H5]